MKTHRASMQQCPWFLTAAFGVVAALAAPAASAQSVDIPPSSAVRAPFVTEGGSLKGEYWKRPPVSILVDGRMNRDNGIDRQIRTFGPPSGTFTATRFSYTGNDLTVITNWLGPDGPSYSGVASNMDDGAIRFTGYLNVLTAGILNLGIVSDDGSRITIGGIDVAERDGSHGDETQDADVNFLAAGVYPIEITYFNGDWTSDGTGSNLNHSGNPDPSVHGGANFHLRYNGANAIMDPGFLALLHAELPEAGLYSRTIQGQRPIAYYRFNEPSGAGSAVNSGTGGPALAGEYLGGASPNASGPQRPGFPGFNGNNTAVNLDGVDDCVSTMVGLFNPEIVRPGTDGKQRWSTSGWFWRAANQPNRTGLSVTMQ